MNHQAIYNTHPIVKRIADIEGGVVAYDADGNEVTSTLMRLQVKQPQSSMHETYSSSHQTRSAACCN